MQLPQNLSESDRHWYDIIQQCRTSGLCDNQWLQENNIKSATFYYHVKQLRKKACDLPVSTGRSNRHNEVQEVVPIILDEPKIISTPLLAEIAMASDTTMAVRLTVNGISVEFSNSATQDVIKNTLTALQYIC